MNKYILYPLYLLLIVTQSFSQSFEIKSPDENIKLTAKMGAGGGRTAIISKCEKKTISFLSLLGEMTDLIVLAEVPSPKYKCAQFSSYDRASTNPDDKTETNWFANGDCGQYLRTETRNGSNEFVMMDADGPGAVVRIWMANSAGIIRFYFDGASEPAIEMPMMEIGDGKHELFPAPISDVNSIGKNCYLPIPYSKHCKVTSSLPGIYYHINYRTYEAETKVETFTLSNAKKNIEAINKVAQELSKPEKISALPKTSTKKKIFKTIKPNKTLEINLKGQNAIYELYCKVDSDNLEEALRSSFIKIYFDDQKPSVQAPVGDFFATAPGLNHFKSIPLGVLDNDTMYSHFVMPFKEKAKIVVQNLSTNSIDFTFTIVTGNYKWNKRSQYFFAKWRSLYNNPTKPRIDWTLLDCKGEGTYLGNMYQVSNPLPNWWGEGDEKIFVDGEKFPSTFGTGTEDYYGYAFCWFGTFTHAYHNQARADGPCNFGHSCVSRFHFLDAIPFEKSIKFDMELWHHICNTNTKLSHVSTVYWYARPGSKDDFSPVKREELIIPELPPCKIVPGVIEGEKMKVISVSGGVTSEKLLTDNFPNERIVDLSLPLMPVLVAGFQGMERSGFRALWWFKNKPGDITELEFMSDKSGTNDVVISSTRGPLFGNFNISINGQPAKEQLKLRYKHVLPTGEKTLGNFFINKGKNTMKIEVANEKSPPYTSYFFVLDYINVTPVGSGTTSTTKLPVRHFDSK